MPASVETRRPLWRTVLLASCLAYASGVGGLIAARAFLAHWPAWLATVSHGAPYFVAPLLLLLPLAILSRSRAALGACLAVAAAYLASYGPLYLPRPAAAAPAAGGALSVMTLNLGPRRSQPERLVAAIAGEAADVVGVEEVYAARARALRSALGQGYAYAILDPYRGEVGLLSRYPIQEQEWFQPAGFGRTALRATLDVDGKALHVFVLHPYPPGIERCRECRFPIRVDDYGRAQQMADVVRRARALQGPVVVLGDMNMSELSPAYAQLAASFRDAYREAGWGFGFTFPAGLHVHGVAAPGPLFRIDYIFYSAGLRATAAHVGYGGSTDHCYVVARLVAATDGQP